MLGNIRRTERADDSVCSAVASTIRFCGMKHPVGPRKDTKGISSIRAALCATFEPSTGWNEESSYHYVVRMWWASQLLAAGWIIFQIQRNVPMKYSSKQSEIEAIFEAEASSCMASLIGNDVEIDFRELQGLAA